MNPELELLYNSLKTRVFEDLQFKPSGENAIKGLCPSCGRKSLYTKYGNYWVFFCERLNECAAKIKLTEIYPNDFAELKRPERIVKKNVATTENPRATAIAYLEQARGLKVENFINDFEQGNYFRKSSSFSTPTVKFWIDKKNGIFWERLIIPETIADEKGKNRVKKANFAYKKNWAGLWWKKESQQLKTNSRVFIVEGVFDALALNQKGYNAVACLSVVIPYISIKEYLNKNIIWVIAFDNDTAGRDIKLKFKQFFENLNAHFFYKNNSLSNDEIKDLEEKGFNENFELIAPIKFEISHIDDYKKDWNDYLLSGELNINLIDKSIQNGEIEFADDAHKKAFLLFAANQHKKQELFNFDFNFKTYRVKIDLAKLSEILSHLERKSERDQMEDLEKSFFQFADVKMIANFTTKCLYFEYEQETKTERYFMRFFAKQNKMQKRPEIFDIEVTGEQLTVNSSFKILCKKMRFLNWTGTSQDLDFLYSQITYNLILTVQVQRFLGYNPEYGAYIFNDIAILQNKIYQKNKDGFFEMDFKNPKNNLVTKINLKSELENPLFIPGNNNLNLNLWVDDFFSVYGHKGLATLSFFVGSLFANQIRKSKFGAFPFLEVYGENNSGKTSLVNFIWKLFGLANYEGFSAQTATRAGFIRKVSQVSNIPTVIIESDGLNFQQNSGSKINLPDLRELYNGGSLGVRGVKTSGNETYEPDFLSSLLFTQNMQIDGEGMPMRAIKSRLISIEKNADDHTKENALKDQKLKMLTPEAVGGFFIEMLKNESYILEFIDKHTEINKKFFYEAGLSNERVIFNHSILYTIATFILMFFNKKTAQLYSNPDKLQSFFIALAQKKQLDLQGNSQLAAWFWETYDFLQNKNANLNHAEGKDLDWQNKIAINLNEFLQALTEQKLQAPANILELKHELKTSKTPKFLEVKKIRSGILTTHIANPTIHCWIFDKN